MNIALLLRKRMYNLYIQTKVIIWSLIILKQYYLNRIKRYCEGINPIPPGGGSIWPPLDFFKITPKRVSLRRWNFVSFSSYLIGAFKKKIPVNYITASYDDVITKNGGANFTVKSLLNWKINEILIKSHLREICTWNFHRMLFIRYGIHYKRKKLSSYRSSFFSIVLFCSQTLK